MTTLWLYVLSGEELGRVESFQTTELTIGRGEDVDLRLQSATVSRHHARLQVQSGGRLWIQDLNSTSGTYLAGERIDRAAVPEGAILRLADVEMRVRVELAHAAPVEEQPMELELEGEWEEGVAVAQRASAPAPAPTPPKPAAKPLAPSAKDKRRAEQVGNLGGASRAEAAGGRKRVLQYSQHSTQYGLGGGDFEQRSPLVKFLAVILGLALLGGLAYGAFYLTQTARSAGVEEIGPE
ncbi:MAG: FHA domain-containing protein [Planctomycetes bacterium]|nr:FHA domain-containing protein [Planctomycetota bacterium]